jgi:hypothetical protein
MEDFESQALRTAPNPPHLWYRYVDDTFVLIHEYFISEFTTHINSVDPNIKFTTEPEVDFKLPFLDTCIKISEDASTTVEVYRKATHTDQYLNFQSNHHLEHKRSVVRTLFNRANNLVTTPEDRAKETEHVKAVLKDNGYKPWIFKLPKPKSKEKPEDTTSGAKASFPVCLPYLRGLSEKLTHIFRQHGVSTYHKPFNTIKAQLPSPKDKSPDGSKCGVIYQVQCPQCQYSYVGETGRTLATRIKEHLNPKRTPTAIGEHMRDTGHTISDKDFKVVAREEEEFRRKVREAIEIRTRRPELNRDTGYDLPPPVYSTLLSHDCRHHGGHVTL